MHDPARSMLAPLALVLTLYCAVPAMADDALVDDAAEMTAAAERDGPDREQIRSYLWLAISLPIAAVLVLLALMIPHWLKPRPERRPQEPTDTTDAWQEAGRRFKL